MRAAELCWEELKNGELLAQAELHGFDVFISCDQNLAYQQRLEGRKMAIIALTTNNWPIMKEYTEQIAHAVSEAIPSTFRRVHCGTFAPRKH
jgi:hypothetical protein